MLRTADKRQFTGRHVSHAGSFGKLYRLPYSQYPTVVPDLGWFDAAPWRSILDGGSIDNFVLSGSTVTAWRDRLGLNGTKTKGGTVSFDRTLHRLPVVTFPAGGAENYVQIQGMPVSARPYSVFLAGQITDFSTYRSFIGSSSGSGFAWRVNPSGQFEVLNSGVAIRATSALTITAGVPFVAGEVLTTTDITHYVNGTGETDSNNTAIPIVSGACQIGADTSPAGTAPYEGWLGEVMFFSTALSSGDAALVTEYLTRKWL